MKSRKISLSIWIMAVVAGLVLIAGCVTKSPLSDVDSSTVDPKLVGLWEGPKDGDDSILLAVVPFDKHGYVVTYCKYHMENDKIVKKGQLIFRAWVTQIGGKDFYTVDIRTPRSILAADVPKDEPSYLAGTWALDGDKLSLTTLDVEKHGEIKEAATTDALQKLVAAHVNDATYFKEFITYKKISADHLKDSLEVLEKFENNE